MDDPDGLPGDFVLHEAVQMDRRPLDRALEQLHQGGDSPIKESMLLFEVFWCCLLHMLARDQGVPHIE